MRKYKIGVISLGCDKNRIDTEVMLGDLSEYYEITNSPENANIIIVNTCGFIESAKKESIDTILEMAKYKEDSNCEALIVTGCLSQRYGKELMELMPEIDVMIGVNDYNKIRELIEKFLRDKVKNYSLNYSDDILNEGKRVITTGSKTAYLKIGEGCSNNCTYCIIPKIRGKYRSRDMESVLCEAKDLVAMGIREIIIVAQNTTSYGIDLYGEKSLHKLLREISNIPDLKWIRLFYAYPEEIYDDLITEIKINNKICKYIDMPIQHISNNILKSMGRRGRKEGILNTINQLRKEIPNIVLRTSLIVGFPGECEEDFNELLNFVSEVKFNNLGVFTYSQEEDTVASVMKDQIDEDIKLKRQNEIMKIQRNIATEYSNKSIGEKYEVLVEGETNDYFVSRSYKEAPEIDGVIYIVKNNNLKIGEFTTVKITETLQYDLIGEEKFEKN